MQAGICPLVYPIYSTVAITDWTSQIAILLNFGGKLPKNLTINKTKEQPIKRA
jgi:hypothetical protein